MEKNKFNRLKNIKDKLLSECGLCNHTGYINGEQCGCLKTFNFYIELDRFGIEQEFWAAKLSDWSGDEVAKEIVEKYINNSDEAMTNGFGLIFSGDPGRGKTMLLSVILKSFLEKGRTIYCKTFWEMLEDIKQHKYDTSEEFELYSTVDFLGIDEFNLDREITNLDSFLVYQFMSLIRKRRRNLLPTLYTTNLSQQEVESRCGKGLYSLIISTNKFVMVHGVDFRKQQSKRIDDFFKKIK